MKLKQKIILGVLAFSLLLTGNQALASTSNGTIDPTYHYAWGENIGFIDFKNITITDTALSGSIYGENIGWIDLSTITNNSEGTLSGYAWGENIGWVDFSNVIIDNNGIFTGSLYGENIGFITFNTNDNNKVLTDWRPKSSRSSHSSSGGSMPFTPTLIPVIQLPTTPIVTPTLPTVLNITRTLKLTTPFMKGDDVKTLQTYLNTKLNLTLITDGIFGKKTKQAVISFQLANQLKGDGIVGPLTRGKLK